MFLVKLICYVSEYNSNTTQSEHTQPVMEQQLNI